MKSGWSTQTRYFVLTIVLVLLVWFLYTARIMIGPLVVAALFAFVLNPTVAAFSKRLRISRKLAVSLVYLIFIAILVVIPVTVTPILLEQINSMTAEIQLLQARIEHTLAGVDVFGFSLLDGSLAIDFEELFTSLLHPEQVIDLVQTTTENIVMVFVVFITIYYLLLDWMRLRNWLFLYVPDDYEPDAHRLFDELGTIWRMYLRGQLLVMFLVGIISWIGAASVGMPGASIIGLIAAALGMIPSVGSSVMVGVAAIVALFVGSNNLDLSTIWVAVVVAGVFTLIHLFENYWLRPRVLGQGLKIHPALIIIGVVGALSFGGVLFALIIVPIISSIGVLWNYTFRRITGQEPWPEVDR
ncbi:MAG: AI-2E family transporter [Anaerolineae bacterium]|nr:AI-2E family transporter [Anaerolineae bacterium]